MATLDWWKLEPTDEQLVSFLEMKRLDPAFDDPIIKELDIYKYHPCELLGLSSMSNEQACYFSCTLDRKYDKGELQNRKAKGGFWKITSTDRKLTAKDGNKQIGIKRTLSFYEGSTTEKNWTDWKMYEYHELPRKDNSPSKGEVVLCRIERKPNKKRKRSSALNNEQPVDSLACYSGNNVSEDILQVEPQLPQNLHLPSTYNNDVPNSNLVEVETHPPPNQHISHLMNDMFQELESQLLPNQLMSPIIEDPVAKYTFELESQLLPNQHVSPIIGDHVAKATLSQLESQLLQRPNFHGSSPIEDHLRNNSFLEMKSRLLPNQHVSSNFEDYVAKSTFFETESQLLANHQLFSNIENNAAESFPSEVRPLVPTQQDELVDFNGLDHNSFSTLQSPLYPTPGPSYSSRFSDDLVHWLNGNSFSALQSPMHQSPRCLYSSSFTWNLTPGPDLNSFSTLQSPCHPQPASSYSSGCTNDLNMSTPQFAAVQEDDLANSHWYVQDDFPYPETGQISPDFNSSKAVVGGYVGGDGSDAVIETFSAWANEYVPMASGEYGFLAHL